jgi:ABC-2 type transport system permease protein
VNTDPVVLVARREIIEGTRSKGFWILLAISAVAVAAVMVIVNLAGGSDTPTIDVAVVGQPSDAGSERYDDIGSAVGVHLDVTAVDDDGEARAAVDAGDADLAVLAGGSAIVVDESIDDDDSELATVVNVLRADIALAEGLADAGLSPEQIGTAVTNEPPPVESLNPGSADDSSGRVGAAIFINIALFLLLQTYGGWVICGVTREKASRVVEVLLSTVTARQLMFGKIIGIGILALLHAAVLVAVAIISAAIAGVDVPDGFSATDVIVGAAWFVLGYALYCSAFAAAGSLCSRAEDAQGAALPIMLPLLAGYIIAFSAAGGVSPLLWVLAFFPPTAVQCMPVLYATGAAPVWAMLLSMAITAAAACGVAVLAGVIYSRSILKSGKRVSWRAAFRRESSNAEAPATA